MSHAFMPIASPSRRGARYGALGGGLLLALLLLLGPPGMRPADAADEPAEGAIPRTEKWYDQTQDGNKVGYIRVLWSPSTWKGKTTVHDTTTFVQSTQRDMAGMKDTFSSVSTSELERGEDGTLWWMQTRVEEGQRVTLVETVWTGKGYRNSTHIIGQEANRRVIEIPMEKPLFVDAESFLGADIRAGKLKVGAKRELALLDTRARARRMESLEVVAAEIVRDEAGKDIPTWKVRQSHARSRSELFMWFDHSGVIVKYRAGGMAIQRTTQAQAEKMPTRPAEYAITVPASPRLERIFNADRVLLDVHVRGDEHRKLPAFPESPWSRTVKVTKHDDGGALVQAELRRHDNRKVKASIPLVDEKFARWLEATAQMQVADPLVVNTVRDVIGEERDARTAAVLLARFVYTKLDKRSLKVAQGDAVQILKECRGDCSEHCLLFVTLCRAAGIPARRCSGYVCIGGMWGSHAWSEIWTGAWIGADPTTGEVGTGARYLFYGYPDEPDSYPGVVSSRARGRIRILTKRIEEGNAAFDLGDRGTYRRHDHKHRRYLHVLNGLQAESVPEAWRVSLQGDIGMHVTGPSFTVRLTAGADQGADRDSVARFFSGTQTTFAGAPALMRKTGSATIYLVFSRRRVVQMYVAGMGDADLATLEKVLAPTFSDPAPAWAAEAASAAPKVDAKPQPDGKKVEKEAVGGAKK